MAARGGRRREGEGGSDDGGGEGGGGGGGGCGGVTVSALECVQRGRWWEWGRETACKNNWVGLVEWNT